MVGTSRTVVLVSSAALVLLAIAYGRASHRKIPSSLFVGDGFGYYIYLPSLIIDGDLDLSNQLAHQDQQAEQRWYRLVPRTGRRGNCFQVGCAVLWSPFFVLAHAMVLTLNAFGASIPVTGFGLAYELPVYCGSFAYGLIGVAFMRRLIIRLWDARIANISTFYIAAGTALAAYLWFEPDMSHVPSACLIAAFLFYLHRAYLADSVDSRTWGVIGILLGVIASVRAPDVLIGAGALAVGIRQWIRLHLPFTTAANCAVACAAGAIVGFLPQMAVWTVLYGGPLTRPPAVYEKMNWSSPDLVNYLWSTKRGVFVWTPVVAFATVGALWGALRGPGFLRYAFGILALGFYFNCIIPQWWVGASFSERRLVDYSVFLAIGIACLLALPAVRKRLHLVHAIGLPLVVFNWLLMLRYFTHDLPEYGDVSGWELLGGTAHFVAEHVYRILG